MRKNKRGQFGSILLIVIVIFMIGIIFFFFNRVNDQLFTKLDDVLEGNPDWVDTEAQDAVQKIHDVDNSVWDWAFLAIFIGLIIQMLIFSFATRISVVFYWLFAILGIIILIVGAMLSNMWQEIAANPEFATTVVRFPITNALLGNYYALAVTFLIFIGMIILFGKSPKGGDQL